MLTVKQYQSNLKYYWGYYTGKVDGIKGKKTTSAIKAYQKAKGLSQTGNYNTKTNDSLVSTIKTVQKNLKYYKGYYTGSVDGIIGTKTKSATKSFQKANSLTQDSIYGTKTKSKMSTLVKKVQKYLKVDQTGNMNTATRSAVKTAQKKYGYTQNGIVDDKLIKKLSGSSSSSSTSGYTISSGSSTHFAKSEFKCHCDGKYCTGYPGGTTSSSLLKILEELRAYYGQPITIVSGQRCTKWNTLQGGVTGSAHTKGKAADIYIPGGQCSTASKRTQVVNKAYALGAAYSYANTAGMGTSVHINV